MRTISGWLLSVLGFVLMVPLSAVLVPLSASVCLEFVGTSSWSDAARSWSVAAGTVGGAVPYWVGLVVAILFALLGAWLQRRGGHDVLESVAGH